MALPTTGRRPRRPNSRRFAMQALLLALCASALLAPPAHAFAWTPGVPLAQPFPRLAMWWPDTYKQSAADLARYDWLSLTDVDRPAISKIRALNPDEILLNSTNACELDVDPWESPTSDANSQIAKLPAQWLLTQVGTTLAAPVTPSATTISVSTLTATRSGKTVQLFATGEDLVIDDEIMYVSAIDSANKRLIVRRGFAKPAGSHAAGARVAATVTFWPRSVLVDVTSNCPRVTVDSVVGPESWAEYNARIGAALANDAAWDGILLDRCDGDESWLVDAYYARSIDLTRSNQLPATYDAFDSAWDAGIAGYQLRIRGLLGTGKLIFTNWGYANYGALNGNNFEGFPNSSATDYPWQRLVEGPNDDSGSYFEWLADAQQPNITTIETYQDDGQPDALGNGAYDNPFTKPGFVPNYQKMRFGLTTALMGDGFFSYEIGTDGHGSLGLMWFDEYDGAGRGRGYLGQPTGPAARVWDPLPSADQVSGSGAFETDAQKNQWTLQVVSPAHASAARDTSTAHSGASSLHVNISATDGVDWHAKIYHGLSVTKGKEYTLSFWARSDATRTVNAWLQQGHGPDYNDLAYLDSAKVTPQWHRFLMSGTVSASDAQAWIVLALGSSAGSVWLDDVQVRQGDSNVWRRNYDSGVAVVNATNAAVTVPLGGYYRKLLGTQAPNVNDGRLVNAVTVGAHDGVVVVKTEVDGASIALAQASSLVRSTASAARSAAAVYLRASKHGSKTSRKKKASASARWTKVAKSADALAARIDGAGLQLASGAIGFPTTLTSVDGAASALAKSVRVACYYGPGTAGSRARSYSWGAYVATHGISVTSR